MKPSISCLIHDVGRMKAEKFKSWATNFKPMTCIRRTVTANQREELSNYIYSMRRNVYYDRGKNETFRENNNIGNLRRV